MLTILAKDSNSSCKILLNLDTFHITMKAVYTLRCHIKIENTNVARITQGFYGPHIKSEN